MEKTSIAFGTFDGLHKGHLAVLENIMGEFDLPFALTFQAPPKDIKLGKKSELIMTLEEKNKLLKSMGVNPVVLDFERVKNLEPLEFLNKIKDEYNPAFISSGFNFKFGKDAKGDTATLEKFCSENKIQYVKTPPVDFFGEPISSTRIRNAIKSGDLSLAKSMLGRDFYFKGEVIHGDERGRTIGFPTINQFYPNELVLPRFGVYASVTVIDKIPYKSVTNIGIRPTFKTDYVLSETHIMDYKGDAYGKRVKIILKAHLRDEIKFSSLEELKSAIEGDKNIAITL